MGFGVPFLRYISGEASAVSALKNDKNNGKTIIF